MPNKRPAEAAPDVDRLAQSMLLLHGAHEHDEPAGAPSAKDSAWSKAPDPSAAVADATRLDRDRYLHSGLQPVDCRFCHVSVSVKKLGPGHVAVQWNSEASGRCAYFSEVRGTGGDSARSRACPKLTDSIDHAVAEGCLDAVSTAPPPGDG